MIATPTKRYGRTLFAAATSEAPRRAAELAVPWTTLPGGVVDGGEIVVLAIKPSMWRPVFVSAPWLVTCGLLAIVLTRLGLPLAGLSLTASAEVILLIALARLALAVAKWIPTWYVLTNRRVIHIGGVRSPEIDSLPLVDIRNTYLHVSPGERLARLGTITLVSDRPDRPGMIWHSVTKPLEVHTKIRRAIEDAIDRHSSKF